MVKYKNKNLKITLSLVVSTMSIVMANCMEDQGSGSSSSNAPAASGSRSSNAPAASGSRSSNAPAPEDFVTDHLLAFLDCQNNLCESLKKNQEAIEKIREEQSNNTHRIRNHSGRLEELAMDMSGFIRRIEGLQDTVDNKIAKVQQKWYEELRKLFLKTETTEEQLEVLKREVCLMDKDPIIEELEQKWYEELRKLSDTIKSGTERTQEELEALKREVHMMENDIKEDLEELGKRYKSQQIDLVSKQILELKSRDEQREQDIRKLQEQNNELQKKVDELMKMYGRRGCLNCNIL